MICHPVISFLVYSTESSTDGEVLQRATEKKSIQ
jgi:hypothetical protein